MRNGCLVTLLAISALLIATFLWLDRTGTVSHANYKRIRPGMTASEVETRLGGPGKELRESFIPLTVDRSVPNDHPRRVRPVVAGEPYILWKKGHITIIISFRNAVVAQKYYREPSL